MNEPKSLAVTELVLRDGHQSLLATRMRIEDMLPIAAKLDSIGYWSLETWGGAVFDSCIRYLGEDPWERLRKLKKAMPKTRHQMLLRGQNLLGYRHYSDDVVQAFVERSAANGIDVFRIFDALNDTRNLETAVHAVLAMDKHAQGTMCYTESPYHDMDSWLDMAKRLEELGCHSICIKDMAGLLKPHVAFELVSRLKETVSLPIALHCHATTGMSTATYLKAVEAGLDMLDTSISSMSMTYGHTATEAIVAMMEGTDRETGLELEALEEISSWFRKVRKKYAKFEGSLKGIDARILIAQVPGGMLTNMENQLREQGAEDKFGEVLKEIPKIRKELGYIPLVTPTSQIVGTQAVMNVISGERYKHITKETAGILKGEYGATPAPVDRDLQETVLQGGDIITCRPADLLSPEMDKLSDDLEKLAEERNFDLGENLIDDVLIHALFPQVGLHFIENRNNPDEFEPAPGCEVDMVQAAEPATSASPQADESYVVTVNGASYNVNVAPGGSVSGVSPVAVAVAPQLNSPAITSGGTPVRAPLAGNIFKVIVSEGAAVQEGDILLVMETMKMETEIKAPTAGTVCRLSVKEGDLVKVGDQLLGIS